jgi:Flp pilus assembly protein TadB
VSPILASIFFATGVALLGLVFAPQAVREALVEPVRSQRLTERLQRNLRLAGIFDKAPLAVVLAFVGCMVVVAIVVSVLLGSPVAGVAAAIVVVPATASYSLMSRQRQFLNRAADEVSPFLNRIASSTKAGRPVQTAYIQAVEESTYLRRVLADSAAKMTAGMRFREALVETIPLLPFRTWSIFVRQLEAHDESGGDLGNSLDETVRAANEIILLHAEARANYATQARQQRIIVGLGLGGTAFFIFVNGAQNFSLLWTTPAGIGAIILSLCITGFGLWFSRKQMNDIYKKQAF